CALTAIRSNRDARSAIPLRRVRCGSRRVESQLLSAVELAELVVERTQRQVSSFASDLQDQAIGKSKRRLLPITFKRGCHCTRILHDQALVIQKHLDRSGKLTRYETVNRRQDPDSLDKHEVRNPRPARNEGFRDLNLPVVIARRQADQ